MQRSSDGSLSLVLPPIGDIDLVELRTPPAVGRLFCNSVGNTNGIEKNVTQRYPNIHHVFYCWHTRLELLH